MSVDFISFCMSVYLYVCLSLDLLSVCLSLDRLSIITAYILKYLTDCLTIDNLHTVQKCTFIQHSNKLQRRNALFYFTFYYTMHAYTLYMYVCTFTLLYINKYSEYTIYKYIFTFSFKFCRVGRLCPAERLPQRAPHTTLPSSGQFGH